MGTDYGFENTNREEKDNFLSGNDGMNLIVENESSEENEKPEANGKRNKKNKAPSIEELLIRVNLRIDALESSVKRLSTRLRNK